MSIESDAKSLTFNEFQKKYGYKYTNIWVAENEIDYEPLVPPEENYNENEKEKNGEQSGK
ncbi:MAG: hypothetical protein HOC66_05885 [Flavobacteriales bacterium]|jgi:hypothetical protein|nr:hypothetical protein [Flavobacteriales bacterium]